MLIFFLNEVLGDKACWSNLYQEISIQVFYMVVIILKQTKFIWLMSYPNYYEYMSTQATYF